eukprot:scaffold2391_cov113-Cylindrotheca_fusiformis.AAC.6
MADDDDRTYDTYGGQDTFAEASAYEDGPAPNADEFTQYEDRQPYMNGHTDDFTNSQWTEDDNSTAYTNPGEESPIRDKIDGPYYDEHGRPYYIDPNGEPYYDETFDPATTQSMVSYDPDNTNYEPDSAYNPHNDTGGAMMPYDPDMAHPDMDDDDYDYDEGVPLNMREVYEDEFDEEAETKRRARRRRAWCCCLILLCCLLILIILLLLWLLLWNTDEGQIETEAPTITPFIDEVDDDFFYDDDIVLSPGYIASCMADYDGNCQFMDQACFPNVVDQCNCNGKITIVPDDVRDLRDLVMERVARKFFGENFTMPIDLCNPINMAMIWLASGNNRDAGEARQRFSLAIGYYGLNGTIWDYDDAWMSDLNECLWLGIQCNNQDAVNSLALDTNNIFGQFPTEIGLMEGLASISVSRTHLTGTLPSELVSMPRLRELRLYANRMVGTIPTEIGSATVLRGFRVETNFLTGAIPSEIGNCTALTDLNLGFNRMSSTIPTNLGKLKSLVNLRIASNSFSGVLPSEIGRMNSLEVFAGAENLLFGNIPTQYGLMWKMRDFRIAATGVGGFLPTEMGLLSNLERLELGYNGFTGRLISELGVLTNLFYLSINNNKFEGQIPIEIGNLWNMTRMQFQQNKFTGSIPHTLGNLYKLHQFTLEGNKLEGTIPPELCDLVAGKKMKQFIVDCFDEHTNLGFDCEPHCCTICRDLA